MTREIPTSKQSTLWRPDGRWFQNRGAAYYAIAKGIVLKRYPRWLEDPELDIRPADCTETNGDMQAAVDGIADWRSRRDRRVSLFHRSSDGWSQPEDSYDGFDTDRWQSFLRRLARFIAFVDRRRAELES